MVFIVFSRTKPPTGSYQESLFATIDIKIIVTANQTSPTTLFDIQLGFQNSVRTLFSYECNKIQCLGFFFTGNANNTTTLYLFRYDPTKTDAQMWTSFNISASMSAAQGGWPTVGLNSDTVTSVPTTEWPFTIYDIAFYRYRWNQLSLTSRMVMVNALRAKWQF